MVSSGSSSSKSACEARFLDALVSDTSWVYRRVEKVTVLDQERTVRRVSLDLDLVSLRKIASQCGLSSQPVLPVPLFVWRREAMVEFDAVESNTPISLRWGEMDVSPWDLIIASRLMPEQSSGASELDECIESVSGKINTRMKQDRGGSLNSPSGLPGSGESSGQIDSMIECAAENYIATVNLDVSGASENTIVKYSITTAVSSSPNAMSEGVRPEDGDGERRSSSCERSQKKERRGFRLLWRRKERYAMKLGNIKGQLHFLLPSFPCAREHYVKIMCPDGVDFADSMVLEVSDSCRHSPVKATMTPEQAIVSHRGESGLLISDQKYVISKSSDLYLGVRVSNPGLERALIVTSILNLVICFTVFSHLVTHKIDASYNVAALITVSLAAWSIFSSFEKIEKGRVVPVGLLASLRSAVDLSFLFLLAANVFYMANLFLLAMIAILIVLATVGYALVMLCRMRIQRHLASDAMSEGKVRPDIVFS